MSALSALAACILILSYIFLVSLPGCNQTEYIVIAPAPYTDSALPPQPFAKEDADLFREQFHIKNLTSLSSLQAKSKTDGLTASKNISHLGTSSHNTQVIYVSALAGQLESGVILYDKGAGPDHSDINDYLPLKQLWDLLAEMPPEQTKLLVIDIASGPIDWRWGQFGRPNLGSISDKGEITGLVVDELSKIPNLAVLTSVAPGETSWSSPILRRSVFSHFLVQGLAGKADEKLAGSNEGGNNDHRITLEELYNYVLNHTNHWVEQNRDPRGQHPQLLSSLEHRNRLMKVVIAEVRGKTATSSNSQAKSIEGTELRRRIDDLWTARDQWNEKGAEQWHPVAWRQFLENLRRAEQLWLAGQPEEMGRHMDAAEKTDQSLKDQYEMRKRYLTTGLLRRDASEVFSRQNLVVPEAHLAHTFDKFLPLSTNMAADVKDCCLQRELAEELSWHSFRSRLWIGDVLAEADQERRLAEDLLFVGGQNERSTSSNKRMSTFVKLKKQQQMVKDLSDMVHLHNRLLGELPELAWWAAQRIPHEMISSPPDKSKRFEMMDKFSNLIDSNNAQSRTLRDYDQELAEFLNDRVKNNECQAIEAELLVLFEQARELGRLIDRERDKLAQSATTNGENERSSIFDDESRNRLSALIKRLRQSVDDLIGAGPAGVEAAGEGQTQFYHWLKFRNALQWSGLSKSQRGGLFRALEESDQTLFAKSEKDTDIKSATQNVNDWSQVDTCWQAMWALQTLSLGMSSSAMDQRWVDWKRIRLMQGNELPKLGTLVRKEFQSRATEAKKSPGELNQLDEAMITFLRSERAARTLHGHDAALFNLDHDPIQQMNEFDLGALCLVQADRYLEDFWGNFVGNNPWYIAAVNQCLSVTKQQEDHLGSHALKMARENFEDRYGERKKADLRVAKIEDKPIDLTTNDVGKSETTTVEVAIDDRVPPGVAALELPVASDSSTRILECVPSGRQPILHAMRKQESFKLDFSIHKTTQPPSEPQCTEISIRPQLLFRGRYWNSDDQQILVDPCEPKSINREYQAPPNTGEVVVYGVDRRDTIFILDCSLSMNHKIGTEKNGKPSRFDVATKALSEILKRLNTAPVPKNANPNNKYVVGLAAFGHRLRSGKPLPGKKERNRDETEKNDQWQGDFWDFDRMTNLEVNHKQTSNWKKDCELLEPPRALDNVQLSRMNAYLDTAERVQDLNFKNKFIPQLQPYGETPLLNSIYSAAVYLTEQRRSGLVIVICDGAFNDEASTGELYNNVKDYYRRFKDQLTLCLVAFDVNQNAEVEALDALAKSAGGEFYKAATEEKLAEITKKTMTPRKFKVARDAEPRWESEADLGKEINELRPYDKYQVRFEGLPDFPATISGGERLEFYIDTANRQFLHRRPDIKGAVSVKTGQLSNRNEPTTFGYLKAESRKAAGVATFQFGLGREGQSGMIERPKEIRIDISRKGNSSRQYSTSWNLLLGQSIPVWEYRLSDWPDTPTPSAEVKAFWKMTRTTPDVEFLLQELIDAKKEREIAFNQWTSGVLSIATERRAGKVLVRLDAVKNPPGSNVADIRVELGEISQVEKRFEPRGFNWTSKFLEKKGGGGNITYEFDVGETNLSAFRIALTSVESLRRGATELQQPVSIDKWDDKLN